MKNLNKNIMEKIIVAKYSKQKRSFESIALAAMKTGMFFYTHKPDKDITAISNHYNIKVKTERLFVISPKTGKTDKIVKVTIL